MSAEPRLHHEYDSISNSTIIIQRVSDLYMQRVLTLKEMCDILGDVGAEDIATRFRTTKNPTFMAGSDGFLLPRETK